MTRTRKKNRDARQMYPPTHPKGGSSADGFGKRRSSTITRQRPVGACEAKARRCRYSTMLLTQGLRINAQPDPPLCIGGPAKTKSKYFCLLRWLRCIQCDFHSKNSFCSRWHRVPLWGSCRGSTRRPLPESVYKCGVPVFSYIVYQQVMRSQWIL